MEDPVVPLERNLYGHPFAGQMRERQFEKVPNWECLVVNREKGIILICARGRFKFLSRLFFVSDVCSLRTKCNVDDLT